MNARISDFCHFVRGENRLAAIYNALTLGIVITEEEIVEVLETICIEGCVITHDQLEKLKERGGEQLTQELFKHKIIIPLNDRRDIADYSKIQGGLDCKRIGIIYLLTTDFCNLACSYCFVENAMPQNHKFSMMSEEVARSGIDIFSRTLKKSYGVEEPQIIFYGGEPLINISVIENTLQYIAQCKRTDKLPNNTSITINTNGTLVNDRVVTTLKNVENLSVAISLDGPKHIHDACRPYHRKTGTFEHVIRGYELLRTNGIRVGFCCTVSRHNVDQLENIARWFVEKFGIESIGFNIMIGGPEHKNEKDFDEYARKTSKQLINCFRFFRECGVYEDRIMRKVNAFVDGNIYYHDCGGCGQQIVVAPDGLIGVC